MGKFGNETLGAGAETVTNVIVGSCFTCPATCIAESIYAYLYSESMAIRVKCAIYRYVDLTLKGVTEEKTGVTSEGGWVEFPFSGVKPQLVSGTEYILVVWSSTDEYGNSAQINYVDGDNGLYKALDYDSFPSVLSPTLRNDRVHAVYCSFTGIPPTEYTTALNSLKAFRTKILDELVGARIIAGLNANHDSMVKMSGVVSSLSVMPYLFGRVREKALALKLNGVDVDVGSIRKIVANYTGTLSDYPYSSPFKVPQRPLPQVDVYSYTPLADIDLLKQTDLAHIKSFILIQAPSGTFEENPEAENYAYDYYCYYPQKRTKGQWEILNILYSLDWHTIRGEYTFFRRTLTPSGTTDNVYYYLCIFLDAVIHKLDDTVIENPPVIAWHPITALPRPTVTCSIAGQHIPSTEFGVYCNPATRQQMYIAGFGKYAGDLSPVSETDMWKNEWTLTMAVEPVGCGTVTPAVGEHTYQAEYSVMCHAFPETGYVFDHWEKEGVNKGSSNPINVPIDKNITLKAVFVPL